MTTPSRSTRRRLKPFGGTELSGEFTNRFARPPDKPLNEKLPFGATGAVPEEPVFLSTSLTKTRNSSSENLATAAGLGVSSTTTPLKLARSEERRVGKE